MKARTPLRVFYWWRNYYHHSPFGDDWDQAATMAAAAMNPHVKRKAKIEDLKPKYIIKRQSPQTIMSRLAAAFGVRHGEQ